MKPVHELTPEERQAEIRKLKKDIAAEEAPKKTKETQKAPDRSLSSRLGGAETSLARGAAQEGMELLRGLTSSMPNIQAMAALPSGATKEQLQQAAKQQTETPDLISGAKYPALAGVGRLAPYAIPIAGEEALVEKGANYLTKALQKAPGVAEKLYSRIAAKMLGRGGAEGVRAGAYNVVGQKGRTDEVDPKEALYSSLLGGVLGTALGGPSALATEYQKTVPLVDRAMQQHMADKGLPVSMGESLGSPALQKVQDFASKMPLSGGRASKNALLRESKDTTQGLLEPMRHGADENLVGDELKKSVATRHEQNKKNFGKGYEELFETAKKKGAKFNKYENTEKTIDSLLNPESMTWPYSNEFTEKLRQFAKSIDDVQSGKKYVPPKKIKTDEIASFNTAIRKGEHNSEDVKALKTLVKSLNEDMGAMLDNADKTGELSNRYRSLDRNYARVIGPIEGHKTAYKVLEGKTKKGDLPNALNAEETFSPTKQNKNPLINMMTEKEVNQLKHEMLNQGKTQNKLKRVLNNYNDNKANLDKILTDEEKSKLQYMNMLQKTLEDTGMAGRKEEISPITEALLKALPYGIAAAPAIKGMISHNIPLMAGYLPVGLAARQTRKMLTPTTKRLTKAQKPSKFTQAKRKAVRTGIAQAPRLMEDKK